LISLTSIDPRVKLAMMLAISTCALIVRSLLPLLAVMLLNLMILLLGGIQFRQSISRVHLFFKTILALFVLQVIFNRSGDPLIIAGGVTLLTDHGLTVACTVTLRLLIIMTAALIILSGEPRDYLQALIQLRIPYEIAFMTMAALRLLPTLREASRDTFNAVQMRGVRLKKQSPGKALAIYSRLFIPIIAEAIRRSEQIAVAMEARYFRALPQRTSQYQLIMKKMDWGVLMFTLAALAAILILGGK
jgi:energy-coupling factor transport system permease protein